MLRIAATRYGAVAAQSRFLLSTQSAKTNNSKNAEEPAVQFAGVDEEDYVVDVSASPVVAKANVYSMKLSPKKLKERCIFVRRLGAKEAVRQLRLTFRQKDRLIAKVIETGIANAVHNHNLNADRLYIKEIFLGKAPTLKRMQYRGRGKMSVVRKRRSHLFVRLAEQPVSPTTVRIGRYGRRLESAPKNRKRTPSKKTNVRKTASPVL